MKLLLVQCCLVFCSFLFFFSLSQQNSVRFSARRYYLCFYEKFLKGKVCSSKRASISITMQHSFPTLFIIIVIKIVQQLLIISCFPVWAYILYTCGVVVTLLCVLVRWYAVGSISLVVFETFSSKLSSNYLIISSASATPSTTTTTMANLNDSSGRKMQSRKR